MGLLKEFGNNGWGGRDVRSVENLGLIDSTKVLQRGGRRDRRQNRGPLFKGLGKTK